MNNPNANIFIDARDGRAYVSRRRGTDTSWTHEPCVNWEALEDMAVDAIYALGSSVTISGIYPCSLELAALALWRDDLLKMVVTAGEVQQTFDLSAATVRNAIKRGQVVGRKAGGTWLLLREDAEQEWE